MNKTPGDRLKYARKGLCLTQAEFGKPLGLNRLNVTNLETGNVKISTLHALSIEYKYKISSEWLLHGKGDVFLPEPVQENTDNNSTSENEKLIVIEHVDLVKEYEDQKRALRINKNLLLIERKNKKAFRDMDHYVAGVANGLKYSQDFDDDVDFESHMSSSDQFYEELKKPEKKTT